MFKKFGITFTQATAEALKDNYSKASLIVEYGTGGSTFYAAELGKKVLAVESSIEWLMELMGAYKEQDLSGDIIPLWVDIGKTKEWGYPAEERMWRNWPAYASKPWEYIAEHNLNPDLVLIDGRFRAACFIATCVSIKKPVRIIFDDYADRDFYHEVANITKPTEIIEDRVAIFDIEPGLVDSQQLMNFMPYFTDPR